MRRQSALMSAARRLYTEGPGHCEWIGRWLYPCFGSNSLYTHTPLVLGSMVFLRVGVASFPKVKLFRLAFWRIIANGGSVCRVVHFLGLRFTRNRPRSKNAHNSASIRTSIVLRLRVYI